MFRLRRLAELSKYIKFSYQRKPLLTGQTATQLTPSLSLLQVEKPTQPLPSSLQALVSPLIPRHAFFHTDRSSAKDKTRECECEDPQQPPKAEPNIYRALTLFVAIPTIILMSIYMYKNEEHPKRPEFKPYEYMRIRHRPFAWGDGNHSLFHNPCVNALPDGYEEDEETACKKH